MHGVKRLFAWMIPRFDKTRFNVSLISLRKKDLSADTLEEFGIDVTYMARHKFDPATFPALLKVLREKRADIVHLHGYGATTFGRLCAWRMGIPAILHEHANHGDTPWFQKIADRLLAPHTDLAIAVSESTGEFTTRARLMPAERTKVVYLGAPLDEFARPRSAEEIAAARQAHGDRAGHHRDRHHHAADAVEGQSVSDRGGAEDSRETSGRRVSSSLAKASCRRELEAQARALGTRRPLVFSGFMRDVAAALSALRHRRLSVVVGRHAADRVRSAGDGEADRRDRCRRPARCAHRSQGRADRAEGRCRARSRARSASCSTTRRSPPASSPKRRKRASVMTLRRSSERWSGCTSCCTRLRACHRPGGYPEGGPQFLSTTQRR